MTGQILTGTSMDDYPLTLTSIVERAERFHTDREVVSLRPSGTITRTTLGACAGRARRLAGALAALGVRGGDRVATLLWNQSEHLELYFAVPAMGAVIHTLNPRLFPDELAFIIDDAQDTVIVVDESLLEVFDTFGAGHNFAHIIVVTHTGDVPAGMLDYDTLIADSKPVQWPALDEHRAAAMYYTSGTIGRPKGVTYTHRALVLHSLVAALPSQLGARHDPPGRPDVPRERLGPAVCRGPRRCELALARTAAGPAHRFGYRHAGRREGRHDFSRGEFNTRATSKKCSTRIHR